MRLVNADAAVEIWRENGCFPRKELEETAKKLLDMLPTVDRDKSVKAVKSKGARYGMGYAYHDFVCPTCGSFLAFEPAPQKIPRRCLSCGQLIQGFEKEEEDEE